MTSSLNWKGQKQCINFDIHLCGYNSNLECMKNLSIKQALYTKKNNQLLHHNNHYKNQLTFN